MDIARGELVEKELDTLIERRSRKEPDPAEREALWMASVRRHHEQMRRRNRAAWFAHFCQMAANHARLAQDYERRAEELCEEGAA